MHNKGLLFHIPEILSRKRLNFQFIKIILFFSTSIVVTGCQDSNPHNNDSQKYRQKIAKLLDIPFHELAHQSFLYPNSKELKIPVDKVVIKWLDFFSVLDCADLQQQIGLRNSQLGKNMTAESQLLYEKKLLVLLQSCLKTLKSPSEKLQTVLRTKTSQFKHTVWNNTWANTYWQKLTSNSTNNTPTSYSHADNLVTNLSNLRLAIQSNNLPENNDWFSIFQQLESSKGTIGSLLTEISFHLKELNATTELLKSNSGSICPNNKKTQRFEYLLNVKNKFYLPGLQKRQVKLLKSFQVIQVELAKWSQFFPKNNAKFSSWYNNSFNSQSRNNLAAQLKASILSHVKTWQNIQNSCDLENH